jgi:hypothetical protein
MSPADRKKGRGGRQGAAAGQGRGQGQGGQGGAGGKGGKGGKGGGRHPKEAPTSVDEVAQLAGPLQQVLRRLPETQRRVLELRMGLVDGHPHDLADTARQLGSVSPKPATSSSGRSRTSARRSRWGACRSCWTAEMSSLAELVEERVGLSDAAIDQLQAVASDWQILADLSFADLLMFCRDEVTNQLVVVAQMRPYTAQTVYQEDLVGQVYSPDERVNVIRAFRDGRSSATVNRTGRPGCRCGKRRSRSRSRTR